MPLTKVIRERDPQIPMHCNLNCSVCPLVCTWYKNSRSYWKSPESKIHNEQKWVGGVITN